jgi:hypothetical protein
MRNTRPEALFCLEMQEAYQTINKGLFGGVLAPVNFSVLPKRKFTIKFVHEENAIVIGGEFSKLDRADILPQLLHEMVHVYNAQKGIEDVTANQYHTIKYFLPVALSVGLVAIKHKSQGWSITSAVPPRNVVEKEFVRKPDDATIQKRDGVFGNILFDKTLIVKTQEEIKKRADDSKPAKTFFLKYTCNCPPPHNSIRSGRRPDGVNALNIVCMNCRSRFICVSEK